MTFDNTKYINSFEDLYNELDDNKYKYFGYTSFQKREWTLILNDLIQIYPDKALVKNYDVKSFDKKEQNKTRRDYLWKQQKGLVGLQKMQSWMGSNCE